MALADASDHPVDQACLPISDLTIELDTATVDSETLSVASVAFSAFNNHWVFNPSKQTCRQILDPPKGVLSPDGKFTAFTQDNNLWLQEIATGEQTPLTDDGDPAFVYASVGYSVDEQFPMIDLLWSPDSSRLLTQFIDKRRLNRVPLQLEYVPSDGSLFPRLNGEHRRSYPGDEQLEAWTLVSIDITTRQRQIIEHTPVPVFYPFYVGYFPAGSAWWDSDNRHAYCVYQNIERTGTRVLRVDCDSGRVEVLFEDAPEQSLTLIPSPNIRSMALPLPDTQELIWYSERSGWAHFYLYDLTSGQLKNAITQGEWHVRNRLHFNVDTRELIVQTMGRTANRNPYYADICRVHIDTGELNELLSSDHNYLCCDNRRMMTLDHHNGSGVSPSGRFVVSTRSRVNEVPESTLLDTHKSDSQNSEQFIVERADLSAMPANWQWPEPVTVKAADGSTDLYGLIFRPSNFDQQKTYPILDMSSDHLIAISAFNTVIGEESYLTPMAWAELGCIVVKLNARGGDMRGTAFREDTDKALPKSNMADCVAGIQQLAKRYPYMDIHRVGVVNDGYCPAALSGMLLHPDFYSVGVSLVTVDARFVGSLYCEWQGYAYLEDFAQNLRGKLLLHHGLDDGVVPVVGTLRIVDALQKANKHFDMLLLPNVGYGGSEYSQRRAMDYVVEHLLKENPPTNSER